MAVLQLDNLLAAMQSAVLKARKMAELQHLEILQSFFELDEKTGNRRPIMVELELPTMRAGSDEMDVIKIPIVSLVPVSSLVIKELEVKFQASFAAMEEDDDDDGIPAGKHDKKLTPLVQAGKSKGKVMLDLVKPGLLGRNQQSAEIRIKFEATEIPEGVVRVNERILKLIP